MIKDLKEILISRKSEWLFITLLAIFTMLFSYKDYREETKWVNTVKITKINNYLIFSNASKVLAEKGHLYSTHRDKHYDYYKYSPTFAFLMAPFALMPEFFGLISWNLLNLLLFLYALKFLPGIDRRAFIVISLIVAMELLGSIQNEQSNGLMTALVLLFLGLMEKNKSFWAIACLMISVYIKLFSIVFIVMLIMYPGKAKNALFTLFWTVLLFFLPAVITGFDYLFLSYERWFVLLQNDHSNSLGYSVMGIFQSWFGLEMNKIFLVLISFAICLIPLIRIRDFGSRAFKYSFAALLLIWVVIFNHKAESPLFVIAMTGIGLWYLFSKKTKIDLLLLLFAVSFVSFAFSDLLPHSVKEAFFYKYSIKALPCLLIWLKIIHDLIRNNYPGINLIPKN